MARAKKQGRSPYGVHPGVLMVRDWIAKLPEKTGKSLEEWLSLVRTEGPAGEKERREWLKNVHKLGTNSAWWLAERAEGKGEEDGDPEAYLQAAPGMVEAMFAGSKAGLRPLYERLLDLALDLGADVKACPCKTIVPLYRNHVFAQIKPTTRTRIDFGLALGETKATGRLIDTGGWAKKDRITHRLAVSVPADVDEELERWLRKAYERDA
jgi:hypothetical protein